MKKKRKTPTRKVDAFKGDKGKYTPLNGNDYQVLELLRSGQYSVIDMTNILGLPDPRSNIRYLRNAGYSIGDYWSKSKFSRHKIYFAK